MNHKIKVQVPVEKRGLLGVKKTVMETRAIEVDSKTYRKIKEKQKTKPFSLEEMVFYDWLDEEW